MDFNNMATWQYFALAGGGVLVLGLVLYFLPAGKTKVPGGITAAFGGLMAGLALGILFMAGFGYKPSRLEPVYDNTAGPPPSLTPTIVGGPKTPDPRSQLASLIGALDRVADRPIALTLTADDRAAIADKLKGLDTAAAVSAEDAKARLDAIHEIVAKDREVLEMAGYRGLTEPKPKGMGGPPKGPMGAGPPKETPPNPFKEGSAAERLKSLLGRLSKK
jgi:hypothetical protein